MSKFDDIPDMPALRARIDLLDAELIDLLARRRDLIARAAEIKLRDGLPARIDTRVEEVVANARRNAAFVGLDADLIEHIWRRLIEAAIEQEDQILHGGPK